MSEAEIPLDDSGLTMTVEDEVSFDKVINDLEKADLVTNIELDIVRSGVVTPEQVMALENIVPGILMDNIPSSGWSQENRGEGVNIALESIGNYKGFLIGGALAAIMGLIWKFFGGSGSSGGSGGGGSGEYTSRSVEAAIDGLATSADQAQATATDVSNALRIAPASAIASVRDNLLEKLRGAVGLIHDDQSLEKIVQNTHTLSDYIDKRLVHEVCLQSMREHLVKIFVDADAEKHIHALEQIVPMALDVLNGIPDRLGDTVTSFIHISNQSLTHNPSLNDLRSQLEQRYVARDDQQLLDMLRRELPNIVADKTTIGTDTAAMDLYTAYREAVGARFEKADLRSFAQKATPQTYAKLETVTQKWNAGVGLTLAAYYDTKAKKQKQDRQKYEGWDRSLAKTNWSTKNATVSPEVTEYMRTLSQKLREEVQIFRLLLLTHLKPAALSSRYTKALLTATEESTKIQEKLTATLAHLNQQS